MPSKAGLNELSLAALSNWLLTSVSTFFDKAKRLKTQMRQEEVNFSPFVFDKEADQNDII